ncbi:MAG: SOS response-associated peptidase [Bacteroidia bacterium]
MCYDIKTSLEKQLRMALLGGNKAEADEIADKLKIFSKDEVNLYHASGFDHPTMFIYTQDEPQKPIIATWGLVPEWSTQKETIWNKTLNARGETIFEKPSFKDSAASKRCLIYLEGFYEHHHKNGKTYPYFIKHKEKELFAVAGLWSEWQSELGEVLKTFSIVTTEANELMAEIHNNPKLAEPRMPLILHEEAEEKWLSEELGQDAIEKLIQPTKDGELIAHTVAPIKGSKASGNVPEASLELRYAELEVKQLGLF